jgi:outer membrane protein TolC
MAMQIKSTYYSVLTGFALLFSLSATSQTRTLDYYVSAAISNSPTLKEDYAKIEQNNIDSTIAISEYKPQVNVTGQAIAAPTYGDFGYDEAVTNGGSYEAVVSASQLIAPRKEIKLTRTLCNYERQSLANEAKKTENELRKDVAEKYLNACLLQQQMIFYVQSDSFLVREKNILKELTDKGIYRMSDYYELAVEEQSEKTQVTQLSVQFTQAISDLNETCGINDTAFCKLSIPKIEPYKQNDIKQLIGYQKFQVDSMQLAGQQMLLDAQYYPHLSWYADAGMEASQPNLIYKSFGNSLGLNLSIPLYDGHKKELKHKSFAISDGVRSNYEQFFVKTYSTHTALLIKQMQQAAMLVTGLKNEEEQVQAWMKVNKAQIAVGNISITDFLLGLKKELEVNNDLTQALINQQLLQNEFNYWNH